MKREQIMKNSISIIVPVYNVPGVYIKECINSLLEQNYDKYEILIINDNSNDQTRKVLSIYESNEKVRIIDLDVNKGVSNARNIGVIKAQYDWIMFVDSDDWIETSTLTDLAPYLKNDIDVLMFDGNIYFNDKKNFRNKFLPYEIPTKVDNFDDVRLEVINKTSTPHCPKFENIGITFGKIYKKSFIQNNNLKFNVNLSRAEDLIFFFDVINKKPNLLYLPNNYKYYYRKNMYSTVNKYNKNVEEVFKNTINEYAKRIDDKSHKEVNALNQRIASYFFDIHTRDYFHINNKESFSSKKKKMKLLKTKEPYDIVFKNKSIKVKKKEKLVLFFYKNNMFMCIYILYSIYNIKRKIFNRMKDNARWEKRKQYIIH